MHSDEEGSPRLPRTPGRSPGPDEPEVMYDFNRGMNVNVKKRSGGRTPTATDQQAGPSQARSRSPSPVDRRAPGGGRTPAAARPVPGTSRNRSRSPSPARRVGWTPVRKQPRSGRRSGAGPSSSSGGSSDSDGGSSSDRRSRSSRRRSASPGTRQKLARGGLNYNENPTPGRVDNPSKYTDRSMYTNLDEDVLRRNVASGAAISLDGVCTNSLGRVRNCRHLVTPTNFRRVYLRTTNELPRNVLMALLVDVSVDKLRSLDSQAVCNYYYHAAAYFKQWKESPDDEIVDSDLATAWLNNAVQILTRLEDCVGGSTVEEALGNKYAGALGFRPEELMALVRRSVPVHDRRDHTVNQALTELSSFAETLMPSGVKIWGLELNIKDNESVVPYNDNGIVVGNARVGEYRNYPLHTVKRNVLSARDRAID